jgi:hypothetical protein
MEAVLSPEASKTKLTTPRENVTRSRELACWIIGHGQSPTIVHWAQAAVSVSAAAAAAVVAAAAAAAVVVVVVVL